MRNTTEFKEIFKMPLAKVSAVYTQLSGNPHAGKVEMVEFLADNVIKGRNDLNTMLIAISNADTSTVPQGKPDNATAEVANRAHDTALSTLGEVKKLETAMQSATMRINNTIVTLNDELSSIRNTVQAINSHDIDLKVTQQISDALAPFLKVVADQGAQAVVAQAVSVSVQGRKSAQDLFGININDRQGNPLMFDVYNDQSAPAIDPNFIWNDTIIRHLYLSQQTGENVWFGGEKGTGKTQTVEQFCALTGRAFTRINFHKYSTQSEYIGDLGADQGTTSFKPGAFLMGFTTPGAVILLDEVSMCPPGELAPLNGLLEPNSKVNIGGQVWRRAPGVLVVGADNTLTNGDDSGRYGSTNQMNSALADRFARIIKFEHMSEDDEVKAVVRHTGCKPDLAKEIVTVVRVARTKVTTGDLVDAPSIRSVIAFVRALSILPIAQAWETAIVNRQPVESAIALEGIKVTHLNVTKINSLI